MTVCCSRPRITRRIFIDHTTPAARMRDEGARQLVDFLLENKADILTVLTLVEVQRHSCKGYSKYLGCHLIVHSGKGSSGMISEKMLPLNWYIDVIFQTLLALPAGAACFGSKAFVWFESQFRHLAHCRCELLVVASNFLYVTFESWKPRMKWSPANDTRRCNELGAVSACDCSQV